MKVKLVAIAKDEAAYLSEWVFHHLHMGFDFLDIYVNNTSDQTWLIANQLVDLKNVRFIQADPIFKTYVNKPQEACYRDALAVSKKEGIDYLMFLDIDEFWMPKDLSRSVKDCLVSLVYPDILSFSWFCKHQELPFSLPIDHKIVGVCDRHVKTIFKIALPVKSVDVHNVNVKDGKYFLADGRRWTIDAYSYKTGATLPDAFFKHEPEDFFILHRMFRSELEYVSLLGRTNPNAANKKDKNFKSNRQGYCVKAELTTNVAFNRSQVDAYIAAYDQFLTIYSLQPIIADAIEFIKKRYFETLFSIKNALASDIEILHRALNNLKNSEVLAVFHVRLEEINCCG